MVGQKITFKDEIAFALRELGFHEWAFAGVTQMEEWRICNPFVCGSIPHIGSNYIRNEDYMKNAPPILDVCCGD